MIRECGKKRNVLSDSRLRRRNHSPPAKVHHACVAVLERMMPASAWNAAWPSAIASVRFAARRLSAVRYAVIAAFEYGEAIRLENARTMLARASGDLGASVQQDLKGVAVMNEISSVWGERKPSACRLDPFPRMAVHAASTGQRPAISGARVSAGDIVGHGRQMRRRQVRCRKPKVEKSHGLPLARERWKSRSFRADSQIVACLRGGGGGVVGRTGPFISIRC